MSLCREGTRRTRPRVSLQDIKFPLTLDVFDLCSEELQNKLIPVRTRFKEEEDKTAEKTLRVRHTHTSHTHTHAHTHNSRSRVRRLSLHWESIHSLCC